MIWPIFRSTRLCVTACGIMHPRFCRPVAPEDGQNNCPKDVELTGIINKPLLLHLIGCLDYLYRWCTVKQISDNEIHLLIKYIKSVLWRAAKRLSCIQDARCLKVNSYVVSEERRVFNMSINIYVSAHKTWIFCSTTVRSSNIVEEKLA